MEKLIRLNANRVDDALEEAIVHLGYLERVPLYPDEDILSALMRGGGSGSGQGNDDDDDAGRLGALLEEQWRAEWEFMATHRSGPSQPSPHSSSSLREGRRTAAVSRIAAREASHGATRNLTREIRVNGRGRAALGWSATGRSDSSGHSTLRMLIGTVRDLRGHSIERLTKTAEEVEAEEAEVRRLLDRREAASAERERLEARLGRQREEREVRVAELDGRLKKTRLDLEASAGRHAEGLTRRDGVDASKMEEAKSKHEEAMVRLAEDKLRLQREAREVTERHKDEEAVLRNRSKELQLALSTERECYEVKAITLDAEIKSVAAKRAKEESKRRELQAHFSLMDRNERTRQNEERVLAKVREREIEADRILARGATQLQKLFRGRWDRIMVAKMKQKKKKGKKGGGGKGKKSKIKG